MSIEVEVMKQARSILAGNWCAFKTVTPDGRCCAMGALNIVVMRNVDVATTQVVTRMLRSLEDTARALHPELAGMKKPRPSGSEDSFDTSPLIFVNNHVGERGILEVFDVAIVELESRMVAPIEELCAV